MTTCIHNVLSGPRWIEHYGEVLIRNTRDTSYHCKLTFCKVCPAPPRPALPRPHIAQTPPLCVNAAPPPLGVAPPPLLIWELNTVLLPRPLSGPTLCLLLHPLRNGPTLSSVALPP